MNKIMTLFVSLCDGLMFCDLQLIHRNCRLYGASKDDGRRRPMSRRRKKKGKENEFST